MSEFLITANLALTSARAPCVSVKVQHQLFEINLRFSHEELGVLEQPIPMCTDAKARTCGTCLQKPVHWRRDDQQQVYLCVGHDDETWDVGFLLPESTIKEMVREIRRTLQ